MRRSQLKEGKYGKGRAEMAVQGSRGSEEHGTVEELRDGRCGWTSLRSDQACPRSEPHSLWMSATSQRLGQGEAGEAPRMQNVRKPALPQSPGPAFF